MLSPQSQEILDRFQVRKSSQQKKAFRAWLRRELEEAGWTVSEERTALTGTNVIAGDPDRAKVLFTAHYDTQPVLPFPNFITPRNLGVYLLFNVAVVLGFFLVSFLISFLGASLAFGLGLDGGLVRLVSALLSEGFFLFVLWWMFFGKANKHTANDNTSGVVTLLETALALPPEDRDKVCLVFFDNEERGMLGSNAFAAKHKGVKAKGLVLNFDCVSDGESIQFFPNKELIRKGEDTLRQIEAAFLPTSGKTVEVVRSFGFYPSDNACFKRSAGVCALKKGKVGWYMDRIHTRRDTVFMEENIALLVAGNLVLSRAL